MTAEAYPSLPENTPRAKARPFAWLGRLIRLFLNPRRKLTASERREINAAKIERAKLKGKRYELAVHAEIFGEAIPRILAQQGLAYRYTKSEKSGWVRYKKFELRRPFVLTEDSIYFEVDIRPGHAPTNFGIHHLKDENLLRHMAQVLGHPVAYREPSDGGFWYIVELEHGVRGIPKAVDYNQMLLGRPATYSGLYLPLGVGENRRAIWKDLGQMPHMLVAGSTLSGKSNALNAFICTLMRFNSSSRLQFVMVDLKGLVEFNMYDGVPHVWKIKHNDGSEEQALIGQREQVVPWFRRVLHQGERRMERLKEEKVKNIGEYNSKQARQHKPQWSHTVVIVDEWADILQDKAISAEANELMMNIASRMRAVGVHLIVCTQVPTAEVLSTRLKTNLPARLALSVPNMHGSMAILGDASAVGLEPQGRAILSWGKKPITFQMPRVTEAVIKAVVEQAKSGKFEEVEVAENDMTDQEIFDWSINDNNGDLDVQAIYNRFRYRRVTKEWALEFCQRVEGEQVVVGATTYEVMAAAGRQPRRLLPLPDSQEPADEGTQFDPLEPQPGPEPSAPTEPPAPTKAVTHQEIWEWAVRENGGSLASTKVYAKFKARGLSKRLAEAMSRTDPTFPVFVDGVEYAVQQPVARPGSGGLPRRLEPVSQPVSQDGLPGIPAELDDEMGGPENPGFLDDPAL